MCFDNYVKGVKMEGNWVLKVSTRKKMPYALYKLLNNEDTRFEQPHPTVVGWGFCGPKPAKP